MVNLLEQVVVLDEKDAEIPFSSEVFPIVGQNVLSILVDVSHDSVLEVIKGIVEEEGYPEYVYSKNIVAGETYDGLIPLSGKSLRLRLTSAEEEATFTGFATVRTNF